MLENAVRICDAEFGNMWGDDRVRPETREKKPPKNGAVMVLGAAIFPGPTCM